MHIQLFTLTMRVHVFALHILYRNGPRPLNPTLGNQTKTKPLRLRPARVRPPKRSVMAEETLRFNVLSHVRQLQKGAPILELLVRLFYGKTEVGRASVPLLDVLKRTDRSGSYPVNLVSPPHEEVESDEEGKEKGVRGALAKRTNKNVSKRSMFGGGTVEDPKAPAGVLRVSVTVEDSLQEVVDISKAFIEESSDEKDDDVDWEALEREVMNAGSQRSVLRLARLAKQQSQR